MQWWRDQDQQSLMASHQFLLSGEVCVMTPVTTYDKSDEALAKVVRLCWSLKPLDINLCRGRWTETEWGAKRGGDEWKGKTKSSYGLEMTDRREWRGEERGWEKLMVSICLGKLGEKSIVKGRGKQTNTWFADLTLALCCVTGFIWVSW